MRHRHRRECGEEAGLMNVRDERQEDGGYHHARVNLENQATTFTKNPTDLSEAKKKNFLARIFFFFFFRRVYPD
jgi:hypothetical protein